MFPTRDLTTLCPRWMRDALWCAAVERMVRGVPGSTTIGRLGISRRTSTEEIHQWISMKWIVSYEFGIYFSLNVSRRDRIGDVFSIKKPIISDWVAIRADLLNGITRGYGTAQYAPLDWWWRRWGWRRRRREASVVVAEPPRLLVRSLVEGKTRTQCLTGLFFLGRPTGHPVLVAIVPKE